jgi:hypothetical protein
MGTHETLRVGKRVEDHCRPCKSIRSHTILVLDSSGQPDRVQCDTCGSQHNYRGGGVAPRKETPAMTREADPEPPVGGGELERLLRRVLREEAGFSPTAPAEKWRGGEVVLRPGKPGLQEKTLPIDVLFRKIVSVRNKLRVLEQQINAADLPDDAKLRLSGYITACYGSLTSFNVLFASEEDRFKGSTGT